MKPIIKIKKNTIIIIVITFFLSLAASYLSSFSNDYKIYSDIYKNTIDQNTLNKIEPLYLLINNLFYSLGFDFSIFIFFISFISLFIKISILNKLTSSSFIFYLLILMYVLSLFIIHEITQFRVSLAIAFGFLCCYKLTNYKKKESILFLIIAILFHYSAILFSLIYIIKNGYRKLKRIDVLIMVSLFFLIPLIIKMTITILIHLNPLFLEYYSNSNQTNSKGLLSITTLLATTFTIINLFLLRSFYSSLHYRLFSFLNIVGLLFLIGLSFSPVLSIRIYELFSFSSFIIISLLYNKVFSLSGNNRYSFYCIRTLLLLLLILISLHRFIAFFIVNPILTF